MKLTLCAFADEAGSSLKEQIDALKRNNIQYVELRSINGKNVFDFSKEEAEEYAKTLKENNIKVWSIGSPIGKVDINIDFKEYLLKVISFFDICHIFNCDKIRMFSFFNAYDKKETVMKYLNALVKEAKKYGISLYHENEKDIYGDNVQRVLQIRDKVPGLKFIYDPANYIQVGQNIEDALEIAFPFTDYFHIKDCLINGGEVVPCGKGDAQMKKMLSMISRDVTLTLEPHLKVFDGYKNIDKLELKNKYEYPSNKEAFDAAVKHLKETLNELGYKEIEGGFIK